MIAVIRFLALGAAVATGTAVKKTSDTHAAVSASRSRENEGEKVDSERSSRTNRELELREENYRNEKKGLTSEEKNEQKASTEKNEKGKELAEKHEEEKSSRNSVKSGESQGVGVVKAHDQTKGLKKQESTEEQKGQQRSEKQGAAEQRKYSPHTQKELLANPGLNAQVAVNDIITLDNAGLLPGHQVLTSDLKPAAAGAGSPANLHLQANAAAVAGVVHSVDPSQADLSPQLPAIVGDGNPSTAQVLAVSQAASPSALPPGMHGIETRNENGEPVIIIPPQTRRRGLAPIVLEPGSVSLAKAKEVLDDMERQRTWWDFFVNLASGTGARTLNGHELQIKAGSGISERQLEALRIEKAMVKRMNVQDLAVLVLLALIYFVTLCFGWSIVYRMSGNASSVTYYADPRNHPLVSDAADAEGIATDFDIPPVKAYLHVVGWEKTPSSHGVVWRGGRWQVAFQFALDLTTFLEKSAEFSDEDTAKINEFLASNNHLAQLVIQKQTSWSGFDELAQNIKKRMKQAGPTVLPNSNHVVNMDNVVIDVQLKGDDEVTIFQNKTWSNFMHNRTTKTLFILSVIGAVLYFPYMWLRCTKTYVKSFYRVNNTVANFWELIDAHLHPTGRNCFLNPNAGMVSGMMGGGGPFLGSGAGAYGSTPMGGMGGNNQQNMMLSGSPGGIGGASANRSPSGFGGFGGQPGALMPTASAEGLSPEVNGRR
mmetsp:Transcript_24451/g.61483  ORF Transcript_24451/g.61483 Transcript_24451/m.61483 type:complete len:712 (-) Transcript_24451:396-2531(-)|eukprot:g713.t1